jgi:hypothetical protein
MSFSPGEKIASSRKKRVVRTMVAHGAHFLCVSNYVWVTKMKAFKGCLHFQYISNLGCHQMRIYCKFSFTTATDFPTLSEFSHGENTMTKNSNPDCLQQ